MPILSFVLAIALFAAQIIKRPFLEKNLKKIFWVPIAAVFSLSAIFSAIQYDTWKKNEVMKIALEQTDGGTKGFVFSAFMNFFAPHLLSFALAGLLALLMAAVNKRSGGKFFEKEEIIIAFLAGFLAGFPGFIFFLFGVAVIYLLAHLVNAIAKKTAKSGVIPLYYFWLPVSASVILISMIWLSKLGFWGLLSV
jgi:hypothetical protein